MTLDTKIFDLLTTQSSVLLKWDPEREEKYFTVVARREEALWRLDCNSIEEGLRGIEFEFGFPPDSALTRQAVKKLVESFDSLHADFDLYSCYCTLESVRVTANRNGQFWDLLFQWDHIDGIPARLAEPPSIP